MTRITLAERGEQIQRKLDAGFRLPAVTELANSGRRRTPEKRALLAKLEEVAAAQGRIPPFRARY
ncbi:hypothetical protein JYK14_15515 [Siccirubricoccus sp. KC 17139]|uniref:Uncharacterized protein n=1 Tax=Siccirubricoccus soli TaxID=2899147 RepID=A0ABT1D6J6_9PROT|nr:hypothetical protein [Siccirubricoccus soli]MCO6417558.1 hypothetical protein [Siccirubricoccus soli]MCP2683693.1 hypothetical protein [Siccirubricoccus soli]